MDKKIKKYMDKLEERYKNPYIQIPNDLIKNLTEDFEKHDNIGYVHYGFSFLIVNAFLYKYVHYVDFDDKEYFTMSDIKTALKYNPKNQQLNKTSKRNDGILEYESYIESTNDIPVFVNFIQTKRVGIKPREILKLSEVGEHMKLELYGSILKAPNFYANIPNFMVDYPSKKGTLNDYKNTFKLTYKEFSYFIFNDKMDLRDFLFYCYVKSTRNVDLESHLSYDRIKKGTGMSQNTIKKISEKLVSEGIITVRTNPNINRFNRPPKTYSITKKFTISTQYKKRKKA